jgi:hypothetical protein
LFALAIDYFVQGDASGNTWASPKLNYNPLGVIYSIADCILFGLDECIDRGILPVLSRAFPDSENCLKEGSFC